MLKRALALTLSLLLLCAAALGETTRYGEVFDAQGDAGRLTVRFLWLGPQVAEDKPGDAMILTSPDGKVMVLDAGHPQAAEYVTAALDALGVTRIDYLVASHPHIDHIGGFPTLLSRYEVGAIYTSALTYEASAYYQAFLAAMADKGLSPILLQEGDSFSFGEEVTVEVFNPPAEITYPDRYPEGATQFINNQSLALKFTYGDSTILLAGDLYAGAEREVAERWGEALDCDVMKANHHGSNTSSSLAWRNAVSPQINVITSDTIEDLNTAKKLAKDGQQMYHTLLDGCIRVSSPGDGTYAVLTEKDRTTTLFD